MPVDLELTPKQKRAAGERCCEPVVYPDVAREDALRMAAARAVRPRTPRELRRRSQWGLGRVAVTHA
jgi:hypothetical protein